VERAVPPPPSPFQVPAGAGDQLKQMAIPKARALEPQSTIRPSQRPTAQPPTSTNSSASWQRPSFKSVELDVAAVGLELAAMGIAVPPPPARGAPQPAGNANLPTPALPHSPSRAARAPVPPLPPPPTGSDLFQLSPIPTPSMVMMPDALKGASPSSSQSLDPHTASIMPLSGNKPNMSLMSKMEGTLEENLQVFIAWLMGSTGAFAGFVVDGDGLNIINRHAPEEILASSALLDRQLEDVRRILVHTDAAQSASMAMDGQNVLQLVWVNGRGLRFGVGLILRDALESSLVQKIKKTFEAVVAG